MKHMLFFVLLLLPINIAADTCDNKIYNEKVLEANLIKLQYRYNEAEETMYLDAFNVPKDFSFELSGQKVSGDTKNYSLGTVPEGQTVLVDFYSETDLECGRGKLITKRYMVIPYFNPFSNHEACKERSGMAACDRFYPKQLTEAEFNEALYSYDKQLYSVEDDKIYNKKVIPDPWYYQYRYYLISGFVTVIILISFMVYYLRLRQYRSEI